MQDAVPRAASPFERRLVRDQTERLLEIALTQFDRTIRSYGIFTLLFLGLLLGELLLFVFFFTWLMQASVLAISLAAIVLTLFAYFTLRLYLQTRKPILFKRIKENYLEDTKELIGYREGMPEHHVALANALSRFSASLNRREYNYYQPPNWFDVFRPYLEQASFWWHWEDVLRMRESLLLGAIDEHIKLVKREPTNLEVHTALANSYVTLSGLYVDPRKGTSEDVWVPSTQQLNEQQRKFRNAAERAIEEFKILNDYAPNDPWIHTQLAYSYHDLQMPEEEIREYEMILKLRPDDCDILFRLGRLSFQQGLNAKGLRVYEILQRHADDRAHELIAFYGDYERHPSGAKA